MQTVKDWALWIGESLINAHTAWPKAAACAWIALVALVIYVMWG